MPESKPRKKVAKSTQTSATQPKIINDTGNPRWLVPVMVTLLIVGVAWVVLFYLTSGGARLPIPAIGQWNIAVGFAIMLGGFGLATRWK